MKYEIQYLLLGHWQRLGIVGAPSRRKAMRSPEVIAARTNPDYRGQIRVVVAA